MNVSAVAAIGFMTLAPSVALAQSAPIVVELYTSQGCSSCPPADALLKELSALPDVLPLALHVDYWDYIGWKDTFGSPQYTARQRAYAAFAGHRTIYTPQMVIGGADHVVGYVPMEVAEAIQHHRDMALPIGMMVSRNGDQITIVAAPVLELPDGMIVQLVRFLPHQEVAIGRGENAGKTIDYVNVVTDWQKVGSWDGDTDLLLEVAAPGPDAVAVILQESGPGAILAAAVAK
jgi:hypothetical protein